MVLGARSKNQKGKKKAGRKLQTHDNAHPKSTDWEGVEKQEQFFTTNKLFAALAIILFIVMVNLYFFVDDPVVEMPEERTPEPKQNFTRPPKKLMFELTEEVDIAQLQDYIKVAEDRILVVAFEEANAEGSRKKLWKRWERIARAIPNKKQFKRLDEDEYPQIVRFDCSSPEAKMACEQLVGTNLPSAIFWKKNIPRFFPEEVRTDTDVYNYLEKQMEEAVKYLEATSEVEYFVTEEGINLMMFGKDTEGTYAHVADILRDNANFGRTASADIAEEMGVEMPMLKMYRPFDEAELVFPGNVSDYGEIVSFIREHSVPLFGEWTPSTIKMYQNRKLPVVFIAVDPTEDETDTVLEVSKGLAEKYWGQLSFTLVDAIMNADLAKRLGTGNNLPEILILSGSEIRQQIDLDNPGASIESAIEQWKNAASADNEEVDEDMYDMDEDYEDEYLDDDEEEMDEDSDDSDSDEKEDL